MTEFELVLVMRMTTHWAYALVWMSLMFLAEVDVMVRVFLGAGSDASDGSSLSELDPL